MNRRAGAFPRPFLPDLAPCRRGGTPRHEVVFHDGNTDKLDVMDNRRLGGATNVEFTLNPGYGNCGGGEDRAQFPCPSTAISCGCPDLEARREGWGTHLRCWCGRTRAPSRQGEGGRLHVAPKVDTSKVLVPDSTKPEEDEVLYLDDRLDRAVSAPGDVLFLKDSRWGAMVGECFRDWIFHGSLRGEVSKQCMR